ncbi:MAG: hypothetical protein A2V66_18430, partial [Ignavibacteria bacterium RBG_13_36_8]
IELASSFTLISSNEIYSQNKSSLIDYLREVPGLSITQQGGPGKISSLFMRGAKPYHTLVLIDGIEVNDPSSPNNAFDFASLQTNNIERIEIVRGPQSTLYGSDAMAGVVNIISKKGNGKPKLTLFSEGGSNGFWKGNAELNGSYSFLNYAVSYSKLNTKGVSAAGEKYGNNEKDGYQNNSFASRLGFDITDYLSLDLYYRFTNAKSDLDQSAKDGDDPNFTYKLEEQLFKGTVNLSLFNGLWEQKISTFHTRRFSNTDDFVDDERPSTAMHNFVNAYRTKIELQNNLHFFKNNVVVVGVETEVEKANTELQSESEWGPFESIFPEQKVRTTGVYAQDQININNSFFASAGIRYDNHAKFGGQITYKIAPAYFISSTGTKIKATYGTGFKAPSLFYLFDPAFGNPNLKPEESKGWDAGIEQFLFNEKLVLGLTYFNMQFNNMFGFDQNYVTININNAETKGVELSVILKNISGFSASASYTYTDAVDKGDGTAGNEKPLLRIPRHKFVLSMNYDWQNKLNINTQLRYIGRREDEDFSVYPSERVTLTSYTIADLAASYQITELIRIYGRIENLFNTDYEEVLYYGTLGRSFYAGVALTF